MMKCVNPLLLSVFVLLLVACSVNSRQYVIGVSQCSDDEWRRQMNGEIDREALLYSDITIDRSNANDNSDQQIADIEEFIAKGVDLLIVAPNEEDKLKPVIEKAYNAGIPVVLVDRRISSDKFTAYVGGDNYDVGRLAATDVKNFTKHSANLIEIEGLISSSPAQGRHKGFVENIDTAQYAYRAIPANWSVESGYNVMKGLLADKALVESGATVFCHNDRLALGAIRAVKDAGVPERFTFVGVDGVTEDGFGIDLVMDGQMHSTCLYPCAGTEAVQTAVAILHGQNYERIISLKSLLINASNAEVMKRNSEYMNSMGNQIHTLDSKLDEFVKMYSTQRMLLWSLILILVLTVLSLLLAVKAYITNRKLKQHIEESANAKLSFFTNVSHDFRTPLTLIADPVNHLLDQQELPEQMRPLLTIVQKNTTVLLRLINQILDFRKYESGKLEIHLSDFDIRQRLLEWTSSFQPLADKKSIDFVIECQNLTPGADPTAYSCIADSEKVERIVYNLLSNAFKFTPHGGRIQVILAANGQEFTLKVIDNGSGMTDDQMQHIFDRFYQASVNHIGTGIGLALVKAFVEMHNGSVHVESAADGGSQFVVTIPQRQKGNVVSPEVNATVMDSLREGAIAIADSMGTGDVTPALDADGKQATVLVIDDSDDVRQYVAMVLSDNYRILEAANGQEGLEKAQEEVPDMIICDVMMPVMDGMECLRQLKSDLKTSHIPVVMLTAYTRDQKKIEGYELGADSYLEKPFSSQVLRARLQNLLEGRRRLQELWFGQDTTPVTSAIKPDVAPDTAPSAAPANNNADKVTAPAALPQDITFVEHLKEYIQNHLSDSDLSVEDISAEFHLGRTQMYRKTKALTGKSPIELLRTARLRKAAKMLKETERSISEITYACGFSVPSYFTKCFHEYYGMTPSEWKEKKTN